MRVTLHGCRQKCIFGKALAQKINILTSDYIQQMLGSFEIVYNDLRDKRWNKIQCTKPILCKGMWLKSYFFSGTVIGEMLCV